MVATNTIHTSYRETKHRGQCFIHFQNSQKNKEQTEGVGFETIAVSRIHKQSKKLGLTCYWFWWNFPIQLKIVIFSNQPSCWLKWNPIRPGLPLPNVTDARSRVTIRTTVIAPQNGWSVANNTSPISARSHRIVDRLVQIEDVSTLPLPGVA